MMLLSCASRAATAAFALSEVLYLLQVCKPKLSPRPSAMHAFSFRACSPGADVGGVSPVPVQMWAGRAQSRCRCGRGEPS